MPIVVASEPEPPRVLKASVTVRLTKREKRLLHEAAATLGTTMSGLVRHLIQQHTRDSD